MNSPPRISLRGFQVSPFKVARSPRRGSKGKHRLPRPRYLLKLSGYLGSCEHGCSEMESSFVETTPALCAIIHPPPPKCVSRRGRNTP